MEKKNNKKEREILPIPSWKIPDREADNEGTSKGNAVFKRLTEQHIQGY